MEGGELCLIEWSDWEVRERQNAPSERGVLKIGKD